MIVAYVLVEQLAMRQTNSDQDCAGVCFGEAFLDDCDVCSGGTTEHEANSDQDCAGVCFGEAVVDDCDVCSGGTTDHLANMTKTVLVYVLVKLS